MKLTTKLWLSLAALAATMALGSAQIERLDLATMVAKTDNAVYGQITGKKVFRIDHPVDGPELYFTTLTIDGSSLRDGKHLTVDVTFPGGFINEKEGVYNSEAPSADDTKLGSDVVAFYKWTDRTSGDLACNQLYASHGGLYRTVAGANGPVVMGRGDGYAVSKNLRVSDLESSVRALAAPKKQ
jgi:hypothetical protein